MLVGLLDVWNGLAATDDVGVALPLEQQFLDQRLRLSLFVAFLAFLVECQIAAMVRDVVQIPGEAIIVLVVPRRADDVFHFLPGGIAHF
ncbi:hypothetical protein D9M68_847970 [compost metagenome]